MADPEVAIIVNLTIPKAHVEVGLKALQAGKHVYSEKPLGVTFAEGKRLVETAKSLKSARRLGARYLSRRRASDGRGLIDQGVIGQPIAARLSSCARGTSDGIPILTSTTRAGGGPMLVMGPYYITDLVNLFGPVEKVPALPPRCETTRKSAASRAGAKRSPCMCRRMLRG